MRCTEPQVMSVQGSEFNAAGSLPSRFCGSPFKWVWFASGLNKWARTLLVFSGILILCRWKSEYSRALR